MTRAYHILSLSRHIQAHPSRRLVYAAAHDSFITDSDPLLAPLFLDHFGQWQALIDLHPSSSFHREPVRLSSWVESPFAA